MSVKSVLVQHEVDGKQRGHRRASLYLFCLVLQGLRAGISKRNKRDWVHVEAYFELGKTADLCMCVLCI